MSDANLILLADVILIVHFCIAAFITFSLPTIWIGRFLNKQFVHNPWFRLIHLGLIGFVAGQTLMGKLCPLTIWEADLRRAAGVGGAGDGQGCVAYWMGKILFSNFSNTTYMVVYSLFFVAVAGTLFLVPIRFTHRNKREKTS